MRDNTMLSLVDNLEQRPFASQVYPDEQYLRKYSKVPRVSMKFYSHKFILLHPCQTMQKSEDVPKPLSVDDDLSSSK